MFSMDYYPWKNEDHDSGVCVCVCVCARARTSIVDLVLAKELLAQKALEYLVQCLRCVGYCGNGWDVILLTTVPTYFVYVSYLHVFD